MGGATAPVCGHSIILVALVSRAEFDRLGRAGGFTGLAAAAAGSEPLALPARQHDVE